MKHFANGSLAVVAIAIGLASASPAGAAAPPTGTLSYLGCIEATGAPDDCSATDAPLSSPVALGAAPGSTSLYAGAEDDAALVPLARAGDGRLSALPCIQENPPTICATGDDGLIDSPSALAFSPDGAQVYAISS